MKPIKNKPIILQRGEIRNPNEYWCKHCQALNSGIVKFQETGYGMATLTNMDEELDNQETEDYNNFEITSFICAACDSEAAYIDEVFTSEDPNELEEEEEEEEE